MIKCNGKDAPWITSEIKTCLRKRNRLYKKFISNDSSQENLNNLNMHSNYCSDLISSSKKQYLRNLSNRLNSPHLGPKVYWSILNRILGKAKIPAIPPLIVNNNFETDFLTKANIFNEFFASLCSQGAKSQNWLFAQPSWWMGKLYIFEIIKHSLLRKYEC